MSGIIGQSGSKSGIIQDQFFTHIESPNMGGTGAQQHWMAETRVQSTSFPAAFSKTLSGFTIGSKVLVMLDLLWYGGSGSSSSYFYIYLSGTDNTANGIGDPAILIAREFGYADANWGSKYGSHTHLTGAITTTTPNYALSFAEYGTADVYINVKGTFLEVKQP